MSSIQALRERRAAIGAELKELLDKVKNPNWGSELQAKYDARIEEVDEIDAEIGRIEASLKRFAVEREDQTIVDAAGAKHGSEAGKVFGRWLRDGFSALSVEEVRQIRATMGTGTGSQGGYTVQTEIAKTVADALKAYGGMRKVATVLQTETGAPMSWSTSDGTNEVGELVAENASASGNDPAFGTVGLNTFKFSSKVVTVPIELLQDSAVDLESFIKNRLVQRVGRITNQKFTIGTGTNEPTGVVTAAGAGKVGTTGQTTTLIYDDLIDLEHSVDPAYRDGANWMMNDSTLKVLKKLKDSQGRPLWLPGLATGDPDTINGYPYVINQDMPVMAANAKSLLFGNFSYYFIRDALAMQMYRFDDSAYAKLGQVGYLMFTRNGGNLIDVGGCIKYYQNSAT